MRGRECADGMHKACRLGMFDSVGIAFKGKAQGGKRQRDMINVFLEALKVSNQKKNTKVYWIECQILADFTTAN